MKRELRIMRRLEHDGVLAFFFASHDSSSLYVGLEKADDGDLFTLLARKGRLSKTVTTSYITQLCDALAHLHGRGIIHRNLGPENILLTDHFRTVKLGGFSSMCDIPYAGQCVSLCGDNVEYMSPEQITQAHVGTACDLWGLGCLISEMLCGSTPFCEESAIALVQRILTANPTRRWRETLSDKDKDLINELLCVDPAMRLSLSNLRGHQWMHIENDPPLRICNLTLIGQA